MSRGVGAIGTEKNSASGVGLKLTVPDGPFRAGRFQNENVASKLSGSFSAPSSDSPSLRAEDTGDGKRESGPGRLSFRPSGLFIELSFMKLPSNEGSKKKKGGFGEREFARFAGFAGFAGAVPVDCSMPCLGRSGPGYVGRSEAEATGTAGTGGGLRDAGSGRGGGIHEYRAVVLSPGCPDPFWAGAARF